MPKIQHYQTNFTSGVLSPQLSGRVDTDRYKNGAETIENFIVLPQGGVKRRPGSHYVATSKTTKKVRLVRFQYSVTQAYILEFGNLYVRFYKEKGQISVTATAWVTATIYYPGDVVTNGGFYYRCLLYHTSGTFATDLAALKWELIGVLPNLAYEIPTPYLEAHLMELNFAQSADVLYIAHQSYAPRKLMRFAHDDWELAAITFNPPATYEPDFTFAATLTPGATTGLGVTFTASAAIFNYSDVNRIIKYRTSSAVIRTYIGTTSVTADILVAFPSTAAIPAADWSMERSPQSTVVPGGYTPEGKSITLTDDAPYGSWRATDVGKYVSINGGLLKITALNAYNQVQATILFRLTGVTPSIANTWSIEEDAWSVTRGYPGAVAVFQDRLWFAGSPSQPQTVWGSVTGDYENFAKGSASNASIAFTVADREVNKISWLLPTRSLFLGTLSGELKLSAGSDGAAVTPTNVQVRYETNYGSKLITPERSGNDIIFIQRSGKKVRELVYSWEQDGYLATDLSFLAEHLFNASTVVSCALQKEPYPIFWFVLATGDVIAMTYDKGLELYAASFHTFAQGDVESLTVVPSVDGTTEEVWFSVKWATGYRTIEYLDWDLYVDSGLTYSGVAATIFSGLTHLIGKTVAVNGNGAAYPDEVVSVGGEIIISPSATEIQAGLPFTSTLKTMRPEVALGGTSQGIKKRWAEIRVRVYQSLGLTINDEVIPFRAGDDLMDIHPPYYDGDVLKYNLGWEEGAQITVKQTQPLPCNIIMISGALILAE